MRPKKSGKRRSNGSKTDRPEKGVGEICFWTEKDGGGKSEVMRFERERKGERDGMRAQAQLQAAASRSRW